MTMAATYDQYVWKQTIPYVWQRSCDEIEHTYAALAKLYEGSGRMFFAITGHISVTFGQGDSSEPLTEARVDKALRMAWLSIRHHYPTVASQVNWDESTESFVKVYHGIPSMADRDIWLNKTFININAGQSGADWANNDPPAPKLPTLFTVNPPVSRENGHVSVRRDIVLRAPHDIIDGIGTLMLLKSLVDFASKAYEQGDSYELPNFDGSEASNLSPPFRVAAAVPPTYTAKQQIRLEEVADRKKQRSNEQTEPGTTTLVVPWKRGSLAPGIHKRLALHLTESDTSSLLKACASLDVTVTHAFHAAIAIALRDIQKREAHEQQVRYIGYLLRNERQNCLDPYNTEKHPAALYHSSSGDSMVVRMALPSSSDKKPTEQEARTEFLRVLHEVKEFYHSVRDDTEHAHLAPYYWAANAPVMPALSDEPLPVPPPAELATVSISSMGRIDSIIPATIGSIDIYEPWVTGEELRNSLGLFLGTYRGVLCLSSAYNDAWHDQKEVANFLERCRDIVFKGFTI